MNILCEMEPLSSLKRPIHETDCPKCLVCQNDTSEKLRSGTSTGLNSIKSAAQERLKKRDTQNRDSIDRILTSSESTTYVWHKSCYSIFTSKTLIGRIKSEQPGCSTSSHEESDKHHLLRSKSNTVDWENVCFVSITQISHYILCSPLTQVTQ